MEVNIDKVKCVIFVSILFSKCTLPCTATCVSTACTHTHTHTHAHTHAHTHNVLGLLWKFGFPDLFPWDLLKITLVLPQEDLTGQHLSVHRQVLWAEVAVFHVAAALLFYVCRFGGVGWGGGGGGCVPMNAFQ